MSLNIYGALYAMTGHENCYANLIVKFIIIYYKKQTGNFMLHLLSSALLIGGEEEQCRWERRIHGEITNPPASL